MADQSSLAKSFENLEDGGQAQAVRLEESVMAGKGCEAQENTQRGVGHGDALKEGASYKMTESAAGSADAANNSTPPAAGSGAYPYSNHSLI